MSKAAKPKKLHRQIKGKFKALSDGKSTDFVEDFSQDPDLSDLPNLFGGDEWIYKNLSKKK